MVPLLYHYKSLVNQLGAATVKEITPCRDLANAFAEAARESGKPVMVVLPNPKKGLPDMDIEEMLREARAACLENHLPVFDDINSALNALAHVANFAARLY